MMTRCHICQSVLDKLWLWIMIRVTKDVCDSDRVGCDEATTAEETSVDKGGTVLRDPAGNEVCVFLVVHLL